MKVLIACEFSGIVRDAFSAKGHNVWSCDLLPTERPGQHLEMSVLHVLDQIPTWDMMIAHPPCTFLCRSGERWLKDNPKRQQDRESAFQFVLDLWASKIKKVVIENPIGFLSTHWMKPSQIIQPWMFGHGEVKATCLWIRGLPLLIPTHRKDDLFCQSEPTEKAQKVHRMAPGKDRWKNRSRTLPGIAAAMAEQWG
jgi:hypothetical protein